MRDVLRALWAPVEARATVSASPEQVFAVLADPETYPRWLVGAQRIKRVDAEFPHSGASFDHAVGPGGAAVVEDSTEAVAADPPHVLVLEVNVGPMRGLVEFRVEPAGEAGAAGKASEVRFREVPLGPFALVTPVLRPALYARSVGSLRRLGRVLSSTSPSPGTGGPGPTR